MQDWVRDNCLKQVLGEKKENGEKGADATFNSEYILYHKPFTCIE